jgi:hypothetical protein
MRRRAGQSGASMEGSRKGGQILCQTGPVSRRGGDPRQCGLAGADEASPPPHRRHMVFAPVLGIMVSRPIVACAVTDRESRITGACRATPTSAARKVCSMRAAQRYAERAADIRWLGDSFATATDREVTTPPVDLKRDRLPLCSVPGTSMKTSLSIVKAHPAVRARCGS